MYPPITFRVHSNIKHNIWNFTGTSSENVVVIFAIPTGQRECPVSTYATHLYSLLHVLQFEQCSPSFDLLARLNSRTKSHFILHLFVLFTMYRQALLLTRGGRSRACAPNSRSIYTGKFPFMPLRMPSSAASRGTLMSSASPLPLPDFSTPFDPSHPEPPAVMPVTPWDSRVETDFEHFNFIAQREHCTSNHIGIMSHELRQEIYSNAQQNCSSIEGYDEIPEACVLDETVAQEMFMDGEEEEEGIAHEMVKRTYQPNLLKRKRTHGYLVRMRSAAGRNVLKRRRAKGRRDIGC